MNDTNKNLHSQAKVIDNLKNQLANKKAYYNTYLYYSTIQRVADEIYPYKKGILDKPSLNLLVAS